MGPGRSAARPKPAGPVPCSGAPTGYPADERTTPTGRENDVDGRSHRAVTGLALTSLGLGSAQVGAPGVVARLVGAEDTPTTRSVVRLACGLRELAAAMGVGATRHPRPWLWMRVAGDALDLGLLGTVMARHPRGRARALVATAAVAGVTAADVLTALRSGRGEDATTVTARAAVTVGRTPTETYEFWRKLENLPTFMTHLRAVEPLEGGRSRWTAVGPGGTSVSWEAEVTTDVPGETLAWRSLPGTRVPNSGTVRFAPAPGGRGTEVSVELEYHPPAGRLGAGLAMLLGEEPSQQVRDDLRRFKQVLETGEVVRSEGAPEGPRAIRQATQRPARPRPS